MWYPVAVFGCYWHSDEKKHLLGYIQNSRVFLQVTFSKNYSSKKNKNVAKVRRTAIAPPNQKTTA